MINLTGNLNAEWHSASASGILILTHFSHKLQEARRRSLLALSVLLKEMLQHETRFPPQIVLFGLEFTVIQSNVPVSCLPELGRNHCSILVGYPGRLHTDWGFEREAIQYLSRNVLRGCVWGRNRVRALCVFLVTCC